MRESSIHETRDLDRRGGAGAIRPGRGISAQGVAVDGRVGVLLVGREAGVEDPVGGYGRDPDADDFEPDVAGEQWRQARGHRAGAEVDLRRGEGQGTGRAHPDWPDLY